MKKKKKVFLCRVKLKLKKEKASLSDTSGLFFLFFVIIERDWNKAQRY